MKNLLCQKIHIILDCHLGTTRPDNVLENILVSTQLELIDFKIVSKCFEEWTFELTEDKKEIYEDCKDLIITKIKNQYNNGLIRYAEW